MTHPEPKRAQLLSEDPSASHRLIPLTAKGKTGMAERNMNDDFVYRNQVGTAIDQLRLALKTADTGGGSGC